MKRSKITNILINFSSLKKGGGQNVALNFLHELKKNKNEDVCFSFWVAQNSDIQRFVKENFKYNIVSFSSNPIFRIFKEFFFGWLFLLNNKIDIVYTYFGFTFFISRVPQVIGSADSNLYYPELEFWGKGSFSYLLKKKIIDSYRIFGLNNCAGIIFENRDLEERYKKIYKSKVLTTTILPSISFEFEDEDIDFPNEKVSEPKGLFLCGWHGNKNILLIPEIAHYFKANNVSFHFYISVEINNSEICKSFIEKMKYYEVEDMISLIGTVKKSQIKKLYSKMDYIFLLSLLESFSNNIIESWAFKKVLVVSDLEWAKALCNSAAIYVNRDSPIDIFLKVNRVMKDKNLHDDILLKGLKQLSFFPSINEKTIKEIEFLKKTLNVYEKKSCSSL